MALALLLAKNPLLPGGGAKLVGGRAGTWCGDRIAIVGSYEDRLPGRDENLYEVITGQYEGDFAKATKYSNISKDVLHMVRAYLMACKSPYAP